MARRKPAKDRKRPIDEAVAYAVGHRIRIEALAILAEGTHSPNEIAAMLRENLSMVSHHMKELFDCGCIESVGTAQVRGATEHFYRAVTLPYISDEEYLAMSTDARREVIGVIVQAIMSELLASFRAEKLETDDDVWLAWDAANLDAEGRREVADELAASFERLIEIKARSANRLAESGEEGTTTIVSLMGFERSRSSEPTNGYGAPVKD
jgi:DNA-binding transcriptional ArsR family regulator